MSSTIIDSTPSRAQTERVNIRSLWWIGPLTIIAAGVANVGVRETGVAIGTIPQSLEILQPIGVFVSTAIQVGLAVIVFALVARYARRPITQYRIIAAVALVLSFLPLISLVAGMMPGVTVTVDTLVTMMVMHVVAAAITVGLLTTLPRQE